MLRRKPTRKNVKGCTRYEGIITNRDPKQSQPWESASVLLTTGKPHGRTCEVQDSGLGSAGWLSKKETGKWSRRKLQESGILGTLTLISMEDFGIRYSTAGRHSLSTAAVRGEVPLSVEGKLAPFCRRKSATSICPLTAAIHKALTCEAPFGDMSRRDWIPTEDLRHCYGSYIHNFCLKRSVPFTKQRTPKKN